MKVSVKILKGFSKKENKQGIYKGEARRKAASKK